MGTLFVDKLDPQSGTSLELGSSGDTLTVPSGATLSIAGTINASSGTATGFGGTNTPSFKAHYDGDPNNAQAISSGTYTLLQLDGEVFDTDSAYNTSNYRFTVPSGKAGKYYFHAQIYWNDTPVTQPRIYIYKNGSQFARFGSFDSTSQPSGFEYHMHTVSALDNSSVGDYYDARVYHGTGSNKNIWGGNMGTFFEGFKLA